METYTSNDYRLYHYGILGMHWGQRNGPPYPLSNSAKSASEKSAARAKKTRTVSEDYARAHTKRRVEELSDKELREILNRINMEQQYSKVHPNSVKKGKKAVDSVLKAARYAIGAYGTAKAVSVIFKEIGSRLPADKVVDIVEDALGN